MDNGLTLLAITNLIVSQSPPVAQQPGPLWIIGQTGIIGAVTATFAMLHRSVVKAYEKIAASQEKVADLERRRADTLNAQVIELLDPIKRAGGS